MSSPTGPAEQFAGGSLPKSTSSGSAKQGQKKKDEEERAFSPVETKVSKWRRIWEKAAAAGPRTMSGRGQDNNAKDEKVVSVQARPGWHSPLLIRFKDMFGKCAAACRENRRQRRLGMQCDVGVWERDAQCTKGSEEKCENWARSAQRLCLVTVV